MRDVSSSFELDETAQTVTVPGAAPYGAVAAFLHEHGWGLHNLGSLPHISVAGATATATHGSGDGNGVLSTAVLPDIEAALRPFTPRTHWGKVYTTGFDQAAGFRRLGDFAALAARVDPTGKFRNAHLDRVLAISGSEAPR